MRFRPGWALGALLLTCALAQGAGIAPPEHLEVPYEPSHPQVVSAMLEMAQVGPQDVVYDLGCGDGRIVVAAAERFGARGVGIDLDPQRIREARENVRQAGVADRVRLEVGDIFDAQFTSATVVTLYLLDEINLRLRPLLFQQLRPGTRVVSHAFGMEDWQPDQTRRHEKARDKVIYLWVIPARVGGRWTWSASVGGRQVPFSLDLAQEFQVLSARLSVDGLPAAAPQAEIRGNQIAIGAEFSLAGSQAKVRWRGTVEGDRISGEQTWEQGPISGQQEWRAQRQPVDPVGTWQLRVTPTLSSVGAGRLTIARDARGALTAQYRRGSRAEPLRHFYDWGGSVRFDLPLSQYSSLVFTGIIEGDQMRGRGWLPDSFEVQWSAARVGE